MQAICHRESHSIQIDFRIAQSQALLRIIDPLANCILVPGVVARQTGTMDIYVQSGAITIATALFLVQTAVLYIL